MSGFTDPNALSERVKAIPGGDMLMMCYSCGTCTSKCMIQTKLESSYNPRRLIREAVFNMDEAAFADKTTWLCTACDLCYPACPQKIHISGVINAVKALAVESGEKNAVSGCQGGRIHLRCLWIVRESLPIRCHQDGRKAGGFPWKHQRCFCGPGQMYGLRYVHRCLPLHFHPPDPGLQ